MVDREMGFDSISLRSTLPLYRPHHPLPHPLRGPLSSIGCPALSLVKPLNQDPLWGMNSPSPKGCIFLEASGRTKKRVGWSTRRRRKWGEMRSGGSRVLRKGLRRADEKWGSAGPCVGPSADGSSTPIHRHRSVLASSCLQRFSFADSGFLLVQLSMSPTFSLKCSF